MMSEIKHAHSDIRNSYNQLTGLCPQSIISFTSCITHNYVVMKLTASIKINSYSAETSTTKSTKYNQANKSDINQYSKLSSPSSFNSPFINFPHIVFLQLYRPIIVLLLLYK